MVESVNGVFDRADDNLWRVIGSLEADMRSIRDLLKEANDQRREFQGDIRTAVTEMQSWGPKIESHAAWIEDEGKPDRKSVV